MTIYPYPLSHYLLIDYLSSTTLPRLIYLHTDLLISVALYHLQEKPECLQASLHILTSLITTWYLATHILQMSWTPQALALLCLSSFSPFYWEYTPPALSASQHSYPSLYIPLASECFLVSLKNQSWTSMCFCRTCSTSLWCVGHVNYLRLSVTHSFTQLLINNNSLCARHSASCRVCSLWIRQTQSLHYQGQADLNLSIQTDHLEHLTKMQIPELHHPDILTRKLRV